MVLNTASRWIYSFIFGLIRMTIMAALVLALVWVIEAGQGEDASNTVGGSLEWAVDTGKRYVWNAVGDFLNR